MTMPRGTKTPDHLRELAYALRGQQKTLPEIMAATGLGKGTLSPMLAHLPLHPDRVLHGRQLAAARATEVRYDRADRHITPIPALAVYRDQLRGSERENVNQRLVCAHLDAMEIGYRRLDSVTLHVMRPDGVPGVLLTRSATITSHAWGHPEIKRGGGVRTPHQQLAICWVAYVGVLVETGAIYCIAGDAAEHQQFFSCRPEDFAAWETIGFPKMDAGNTARTAAFATALQHQVPIVARALETLGIDSSTLMTRKAAISPRDPSQRTRIHSKAKEARLKAARKHIDGPLPALAIIPPLARRRVVHAVVAIIRNPSVAASGARLMP